jgi:hypothetical protein
MSTVQSVHLTLKAVRLLELCEAKGFEKIDDLLLASIDDSVCPAICMECGCTAQMEPDQCAGYRENCGKPKVMSCLVLADLSRIGRAACGRRLQRARGSPGLEG